MSQMAEGNGSLDRGVSSFIRLTGDGVCFDPLNPELDIVKEEHDFEEEPAIKNELSSVDEEGASKTDRQDAGLTMRRFDGEEFVINEEQIFIKSEFSSCAGSDESALVDNNDGDGMGFDPLNPELDIVKEEHDFEEEPTIKNEPSSATEEEATNTARKDAGLSMRRFDGEEFVIKEEQIFEKSEFASCAGSGESALVDNNDGDGVCFDPLNPELDIVKEEHDFEEEPAIKNGLSSVDEERASKTDRQDASCAGSDESALVDNNDGEKQYPCQLCNYLATRLGDLKRHMRTHTGEKPHSCKLCHYKTAEPGNLSAHMRSHTGEKPYSCKVCNYKATRPGDLTKHIRTHTGEKPHSCKLCNYKAAHPGDLSKHVRTHTGEKPYPCKICNYKAAEPGHLSAHMRTHTGEKPYSCKICNYKAAEAGNLSRHMRTHTGEKPYSCNLCNYKAAQSGDVSKHMRTHTGETPYSCKQCDFKATQSGDLLKHMRTHSGETPYSCELCEYKAIRPGALKRHMRTHTGEKPYSCELCDYKAAEPGHLSRHMRTHTGEKPYPCKLCKYKAAEPGHLTRHMRTHTATGDHDHEEYYTRISVSATEETSK